MTIEHLLKKHLQSNPLARIMFEQFSREVDSSDHKGSTRVALTHVNGSVVELVPFEDLLSPRGNSKQAFEKLSKYDLVWFFNTPFSSLTR